MYRFSEGSRAFYKEQILIRGRRNISRAGFRVAFHCWGKFFGSACQDGVSTLAGPRGLALDADHVPFVREVLSPPQITWTNA